MGETSKLHCEECVFRKEQIIEFLFLICLCNTKLKLDNDQIKNEESGNKTKLICFVYISILYFIMVIY